MEESLAQDTQLQHYVYGVAAAPNFASSGICFAAHASSLNRSDDGGVSWHTALTLDPPLPATSIAIAAEGTVFAGVPGGVVRSHDNGESWYRTPLPDPPPFIAALAVSPSYARDGSVFAATMEDGVFVSHDRGRSWQSWNIGLFDHSILCLAVSPVFEHDNLLLAGTESGIFFSTNGGRYWHETAFPISHAPVLCLALAADGTLLAGTTTHGLCASHDRGQSWRAYATPPGAINALLLAAEFPTPPHMLALIDDALFISRDGGGVWLPCNAGGEDGAEVASVAAPLGLAAGCPLLMGLADGRVQRHTLGAA